MGQLRSALRAFALDAASPSGVLERLSRLLRQLEVGRTATLVYLTLDPHGGMLRLSSAGHPPPLVSPEGGDPAFVELAGSVPLGATRHVRYDDVELTLEPGSALVLYTDGLVERAGESLEAGLGRLAAVVGGSDDDLEHLGDLLVDKMLPEGTSEDDAALLMVRALPLADTLVAEFPAEVESIPLMRRMLGRWLIDAGATRADVDDLTLAAAEACANAIEHAYGLAPGIVQLRAWSPDGVEVKVAIRDFGTWRPPRGRNRGRGLMLMQGLTDDVDVTRGDEGTMVELTRRIGAVAA
jgi:anti-sigma regulatory factor (Ser/Thr protein kinase)